MASGTENKRQIIEREIRNIKLQQGKQLREIELPSEVYDAGREFVKSAPNFNSKREPVRFRMIHSLPLGNDSIYEALLSSVKDTLTDEKNIEEWQSACKTLLTYAQNLILAPQRPEFRRIKLSNSHYVYNVSKKFKRGDEILMCMGYSPGKTTRKGEEQIVQDLEYGGGRVITQQVVDTAVDLVVLHCELELLKGRLAREGASVYDLLHHRSEDYSSRGPPPIPAYHDPSVMSRSRASPAVNQTQAELCKELKHRNQQGGGPIHYHGSHPQANAPPVAAKQLPNRPMFPPHHAHSNKREKSPPVVPPHDSHVQQQMSSSVRSPKPHFGGHGASSSPIDVHKQLNQEIMQRGCMQHNEKQLHDKALYKRPLSDQLSPPVNSHRRGSAPEVGGAEKPEYKRFPSSDNFVYGNQMPAHSSQPPPPSGKRPMIPPQANNPMNTQNNLDAPPPPERRSASNPPAKSANFPRNPEYKAPLPLPPRTLPPNPDELPRPVVNHMQLEAMHANACDSHSSSHYMPSFQDARSVSNHGPSGSHLESLMESNLPSFTPSPGNEHEINEHWRPIPQPPYLMLPHHDNRKPSSTERMSDSSEDLYNSGSNKSSAPSSLEAHLPEGSPSRALRRAGHDSSRYEPHSSGSGSSRAVAQSEVGKKQGLEKHHSYENDEAFVAEYERKYGEGSFARQGEQYDSKSKPTVVRERSYENDEAFAAEYERRYGKGSFAQQEEQYSKSKPMFVHEGDSADDAFCVQSTTSASIPDPGYVNHNRELLSHSYQNIQHPQLPSTDEGEEETYATVMFDQRPLVQEHCYGNVQHKPPTTHGYANLPRKTPSHSTSAPLPTEIQEESNLDSRPRPLATTGHSNFENQPMLRVESAPIQTHAKPLPPQKPDILLSQQQWQQEQKLHPHDIPPRTIQRSNQQHQEQRFPNEVSPRSTSPAKVPMRPPDQHHRSHSPLRVSEGGAPTKRGYINFDADSEGPVVTDDSPMSPSVHVPSERNDMNYDASAAAKSAPPRNIKRQDMESFTPTYLKQDGSTQHSGTTPIARAKTAEQKSSIKDQPKLYKPPPPTKLKTDNGWTCTYCLHLHFDMNRVSCEVCKMARPK